MKNKLFKLSTVIFIIVIVSIAYLPELTRLYSKEPVRPEKHYIWWEGEEPLESNFPKQTYFSPASFPQNQHLLSEGNWLTSEGKRKGEALYAKYEVTVEKENDYNFWSRKFWKHGPFKWRFDKQEWQICTKDIALADDTFLKQYLCANWVYLGKVHLKPGKHIFKLELLAKEGEELVSSFDSFLLIPGPFIPRGKLKPDDRSNVTEEGYFSYEPGIDPFDPGALLDLSYLNEKEAGRNGFVTKKNNDFILGNGEKVRFWGVNIGPENMAQNHDSIDYLAKGLAKKGVNIVRAHGGAFKADKDPADIDPQRLDNIHYIVSAFKKQGIYTELSFYFPLWIPIKPHYGIPGYESIDNKFPFALIYFEERFQEIYKSWLKKILTAKNPYTGLALKDDSALALIELVNEDSYFFWTFSKANIPEVHRKKLQKIFGAWLEKRHGSLEKAFEAWGNIKHEEDSLPDKRAGLFDAWHMTRDGVKQGGADKVKRISDQVRFLTEHQRQFYIDMKKYVNKELGAKSLILASNWTVADMEMLDALERYTYTACDAIDKHGYIGGKHEGRGSSYMVEEGHTFENFASTKAPGKLPLQFFQVDGFPHMISELGWPNPNFYRADAIFLAAAYGALQGVDGFFFFAVGNNYLQDTTMLKFGLTCPVILGTFPANALIYRKRYVKESDKVIRQKLDLEDLYAMKGSGNPVAQALDQLREFDIPEGKKVKGAISRYDPLSFYVGGVYRDFKGEKEKSWQIDFSKYIDREKKVVRSLTGELVWDYENGLVTVDTPYCKGAAGFLAKAAKIKLNDAILECGNEYASIIIISLDGKPINKASKILIQVMTEEKPYGFETEGNKITKLGGIPFLVKNIEGKISMKDENSSGKLKIIALDENGYKTDKKVDFKRNKAGQTLNIELNKDVLYYVIKR